MIAQITLAVLVATAAAAPAHHYPPLSQYMMPAKEELALAKTAAPESVTEHATFEVLTAAGYHVVRGGDNGFVCLVLRGWAAPTYTPKPFRDLVYDPRVRAPICYNAEASRTVLKYQLIRASLAMSGKNPDEIAQGVEAAYADGRIPKMERVSFAYMFSGDMFLGPGAGHFHPHMMVFAPNATAATLGSPPFGGMAPFQSDDGGTPFAVVVIPVDENLAVHVKH